MHNQYNSFIKLKLGRSNGSGIVLIVGVVLVLGVVVIVLLLDERRCDV